MRLKRLLVKGSIALGLSSMLTLSLFVKNTDRPVKTLYSQDITSENSAHLIGMVNEESIQKVIDEINSKDVKYLLITSQGGIVEAGLKLVEILDQRRDIICIADEAQSMAFIILQTCETRVITREYYLMTHKAQIVSSVEAFERRNVVAEQAYLQDLNHRVAIFLADRLGMDVELYKAKVQENDWVISVEDLQTYKIIDGIYEDKISTKF
jgi:ATP-dependent protease ClpP protease subunit